MRIRPLVAVALLSFVASCGRCSSSTRRSESVSAAPEGAKSAAASGRPSPFLAPLPAGGAIYGTLRLDALDALWAILPSDAADARKDLERRLGATLSRDALRDELSLDATRPVAFAVIPGASTEMRALLQSAKKDGATHAAIAAAVDAAQKLPRPPMGAMRIVLPVRRDANLEPLFDVLRRTVVGGSVKSCTAPSDCAELGALRPVFFGVDTAVYREDDVVRVDRLFDRSDDAAQLARWLAWLGASKGGPKDRCAGIEDDALVSICSSTHALAALGEGSGSFKVLSAVSSPGIDEAFVGQILDEGVKEIAQGSALADAMGGDLDDGTYTLRFAGGRARIEASFRLGRRTPPGFDAERCAKSADDAKHEIFDPLRAALTAEKPAFASMTELHEAVLECGWSGWGILAAGQWTLALPFVDAPSSLPFDETCVRVEGGRLRARATADPKAIVEAFE